MELLNDKISKKYNRIIKPEELEEYDEFLKKHYRCHYAQSKKWANIKNEWKNEIIVVRDEQGQIKGSLSVLIRKIPYLKNTLMYAPRGPICDENDKETFSKLTKEADILAKKYNAFMLKMDPDILNTNEYFKNIAKENGFKVAGRIKDSTKLMQPRFVFRLNLKGKTEEEVFNSFHSKTRYNIRLASRRGVTLREGTRKDLDKFKEIMDITGERDGFYIRDKKYFELIYDNMMPDNCKLMFAEYDGEAIACVMNILYGNKQWYLYGGSSNKHRNLMPNYLLQWEMIKKAIQDGCDVYDFRGICAISENDRNEGLYRFKKGFNAELVEFMEIYKVYNKLIYFIFEHFAYVYRDLKLKIIEFLKNLNRDKI
jgi:peptidoglycan pentaglycine glycine transferase (the first glycine)